MTDFNHRRAPILDGRLSAAMELAGDTSLFADIGADHGRLSTVMLLADPKRRALVADISASALSKARALINRMSLSNRTVFAVADGLDALDELTGDTPDTVFVLGMGGDTVAGILQRGQGKLKGARLVLGAQTELPLVRKAIEAIGYEISREVIANEHGRDYILIRAEVVSADRKAYTEEQLLLGPVLLEELPENWLPVLQRRERLLTQGVQAMQETKREKDLERLELFARELSYVQCALAKLRKDDH